MDGPTILSGEAYYLERKLLPPGALLTVSLEDVSTMDFASTMIAKTERTLEGAPPYPFELSWEPGAIEAGLRYSLRATISVSDRMIMTSTQTLDAFTHRTSCPGYGSSQSVERALRRATHAAPTRASPSFS
ncbi:MAG: YbaY family lipoprotein [Pseudomonadota bacterium]|nr:YbaY family lipoprotein [Pseudomonadota bacterium]